MANTFSSRVTAGEYNFFVGLHKNPWFCTILSVEFILQVRVSIEHIRSFLRAHQRKSNRPCSLYFPRCLTLKIKEPLGPGELPIEGSKSGVERAYSSIGPLLVLRFRNAAPSSNRVERLMAPNTHITAQLRRTAPCGACARHLAGRWPSTSMQMGGTCGYFLGAVQNPHGSLAPSACAVWPLSNTSPLRAGLNADSHVQLLPILHGDRVPEL